jgi:hypothetical protein
MSERCHDNNHKGWRHPTERSEHWEIHDADDDDGSSCALLEAESVFLSKINVKIICRRRPSNGKVMGLEGGC